MNKQRKENTKRFVRAGLAVLLCTASLTILAVKSRRIPYVRGQKQAQQEIPVTVSQPDPQFGVAVTLDCGNAHLTSPNTLEGVRCTLRNNTKKYISAATVAVSVTLNTGGNLSTSSSYVTVETMVHPDIQDEHPNNLVPPDCETPIEPLTETYNSDVIQKVELSINYVEFSDNSFLGGPNTRGSQIIAEIRRGAEKYKEWIRARYHRAGQSLAPVVSELDPKQPLPPDLNISSGNEEQGARIYRRHAHNLYKQKGAESLVKQLARTRS